MTNTLSTTFNLSNNFGLIQKSNNSDKVKSKLDAAEDKFIKAKSDKQNKSSENPMYKKIGLLAAVGLGIAGVVGYVMSKGKLNPSDSNMNKINDNLVKYIDFKPAESIEDAIEFGIKKLGIEEYVGFNEENLELINFINEGLVKFSNKLKGEVDIPKCVCYQSLDIDKMFCAIPHIDPSNSSSPSVLFVNKDICEDMPRIIKNTIKEMEKKNLLYEIKRDIYVNTIFSKSIRNAVSNAKQEFDYDKSIASGLNLKNIFVELVDEYNKFNQNPIDTIEFILRQPKYNEILEQQGIQVDISNIKKMSFDEQSKIKKQLMDKLTLHKKREFINKMFEEHPKLYLEISKNNKNINFQNMTDSQVKDIFSQFPYELKSKTNINPVVITADLDNISPFRELFSEMAANIQNF